MPTLREIANGVLQDLVKGSVVQVDPRPKDRFAAWCSASDLSEALMMNLTFEFTKRYLDSADFQGSPLFSSVSYASGGDTDGSATANRPSQALVTSNKYPFQGQIVLYLRRIIEIRSNFQ